MVEQDDDKSIAQWRVKQLIKSLEAARGNGTSMISLIIPPRDQIARVNKMLGDEFGTASNIKNRVNRLSVLDAITSTQQRLKLYNRVPQNGLVVYCGTILTAEGKEKKVTIDFEPFKPINTSLYLCVTGDAVVATACGLGRRLDGMSLEQQQLVFGSLAGLSSSPENGNIHTGQVEAFLKKGVRECVTVTLRDGRSLTCTPDHRVLVLRGNGDNSSSNTPSLCWVPAEKLSPESDRLLCGLDTPLDTENDDDSTLPFEERTRQMAFARLCGLAVCQDGSLYWSSASNQLEANIRVAHQMDVESVQADIRLVCAEKSSHVQEETDGTFLIQAPPSLAFMFAATRIAIAGDIMEEEPRWPSFVPDENTPLSVLREFVAGVMGADGHAPRIRSGCLDQQTVISQSCRPHYTKALSRKMSQFCDLLTHLGVNGAVVCGPQETIDGNDGVVSHCYSVQLSNSMGSIEFDEKIGFRHNIHKQALNSAAAVYRRLHNRHLTQHIVTGACQDFETVLREIGALQMFVDNALPEKGIAPLLLSVASVCPAGEKEVYDISVPALGSFTANGIVVHNCDNKFHTEPLNELLQSDDRFGFIIVDGNGVLFGTLSGNTREVVHRMTVDLPKKHGRGGQSALRFARLRLEKRHNYLRKVTELATQFFITNDRPNVAGLVLAGSADFKTELNASDMFDPRLQTKVVAVVDIAYGGDAGFNQAIELAAEVLANVKFIQEKKLITKYFEEISQDTGKYVFGVEETLRGLEMGAVETLIVWENLDITRYTLRSPSSGETKIVHLTPEQAKESSHFIDPATGNQYDVETIPLVEWFANNYKSFGCQLEFITNRSQEGSQFCRGFGGIGGLLRYKVEFEVLVENDGQDDDLNLEDYI